MRGECDPSYCSGRVYYGANRNRYGRTGYSYCQGSIKSVVDRNAQRRWWYPASFKANALIEYEHKITGIYKIAFKWTGDGLFPNCPGSIYVSENVNGPWTQIVKNKTALTKQYVEATTPFKYLKVELPSATPFGSWGGWWSSCYKCGWVGLKEIDVIRLSSCGSHTSSACYDNDEYWYDSCGNREDKKLPDCGSDSTGAWGGNYCKADGKLYHSRTVYQKGCASNSCYSNTSTEEVLVDPCDDSPGMIGTCDADKGACVYTPIAPPPPPTLTISANPTSIFQGEETTISWTSTNIESCVGSRGGSYFANGSFTDNPSVSRDYILICTPKLGDDITGSVTVTVKEKPTLSLDITDSSNKVVDDDNFIYPGEAITIAWKYTNMASCSGTLTDFSSTPGSVVNVPTFPSSPPYEYTYTINCTGLDGSPYSVSKTVYSTRDNGICDDGETYPIAPEDCPFKMSPF